MLKNFSSRRGQAVSAEYAVTLMIVIAAVAAMSLHVKRSFQAKVRDAHVRAIHEASASLGQTVACEYEPYYVVSYSNDDLYKKTSAYLQSGVYDIGVDSKQRTSLFSEQLSPLQDN